MTSIENILIAIGILLFSSVFASKASSRFGIPALLFFLAIGMFAGSEGPIGIYFDNPWPAQALGVVSLVLILFSGGLDTELKNIRPVLWSGITLSTVGVLITTILIGLVASFILKIKIMEGLLLGATVSSTDAAAVFTVLRGKSIHLRRKIRPLLEFESGSNDPMAVFLTTGILQLMLHPAKSNWTIIPFFFQQMILGAIVGYVMGKITWRLINNIKLEFAGLYPVLTISAVLMIYGITESIGGNGFLAVYLAGIVLGQENFIKKKSLVLFHDGLAWLMQIAMFLTLGLLVLPKQLFSVAVSGILLSIILVFLVRPISVFISLIPFKIAKREKAMISWVGLRGAVPIILATYPLLARVPHSALIFNVVFFIVLTSVLLQGPLISYVAKWLKAETPNKKEKYRYPFEYIPTGHIKSDLIEIQVPMDSWAVDRPVIDLNFPKNSLILIIHRGEDVIIPRGGTLVKGNDNLLILADASNQTKIKNAIVRKAF